MIAGSGVNLNGEANLTFDGSTLGITGSIDLSADIDVDGTANLDVLDVDGASNFGADVVFAGAAGNITFDQVRHNDLYFKTMPKQYLELDQRWHISYITEKTFIDESGTGDLNNKI